MSKKQDFECEYFRLADMPASQQDTQFLHVILQKAGPILASLILFRFSNCYLPTGFEVFLQSCSHRIAQKDRECVSTCTLRQLVEWHHGLDQGEKASGSCRGAPIFREQNLSGISGEFFLTFHKTNSSILPSSDQLLAPTCLFRL
jgi:hypothetical protein